jgi:flagellin
MLISIASPSSPQLPSQDGLNRAAQRISNGVSVDFTNNAAEAAIAGRLNSTIGESTVGYKNVVDQISSLQKADSTLGFATSLIEQASGIEVQLGNGSISDSDKALLKANQANLLNQADEAIENSSFNGDKHFTEESHAGLRQALDDFNSTLDHISERIIEVRASLDAKINGLESEAQALLDQQLVNSQALGRIVDTDYAEATAKLIQEEFQLKANVAVFDHQRLAEESVLELLS